MNVREARLLPPPAWSNDPLSEFLDNANRNRFASFANKNRWFDCLSKIDGCFLRIGMGWLNPPDLITPLFFYRAHAAFRAACDHALAGQTAGVFPVNRACLEYAGYALHIHANPGFDEIWINRHDDANSKRAVRQYFEIAKIRETIARYNIHVEPTFYELYERCIDFGSHPNERAIMSNLKMKKGDQTIEYKNIYLHGDGLNLLHELKSTAQVGSCALEILREAFKARFELLGVNHELLRLRRVLKKLIS